MVVSTKRIQIITEFLTKNAKGLHQVMGMNQKDFRDLNTVGLRFNTAQKNLTTSGAKLGNRFRMMTAGIHGFRMEMLGVMFFGMAIQRIFTGLIRNSLEWTGVFDVMSAALGILFLPLAMQLLDWALMFLDWVSQLSEGQKKWIGWIVLAGIVLGTLLFVIGTLVLGIGAMAIAFGTTAAVIVLTIGLVIGVIIAVIAIGVLLFFAWKKNWLGMRDVITMFVNGVVNMFKGFWNILMGMVKVFVGFFTGDFNKMGEGIKQIFQGIWQGIKGIFQIGLASIWGFIKSFLNLAIGAINTVLKAGAGIGNFLTGKGFTTAGALQIPSFQTGGIMPHTGLAMLHKGETITPAGQGGNGVTININNPSVRNDSDIRKIAEMVKKAWINDFERLSTSRGSV